jgi:hypothetical protein
MPALPLAANRVSQSVPAKLGRHWELKARFRISRHDVRMAFAMALKSNISTRFAAQGAAMVFHDPAPRRDRVHF